MWAVETTDEFDEWFASLGDAKQDELDTRLNLLKSMGPFLKCPYADTLKGSQHANMKELRGRTATAVLRVAFAFDPQKTAILLAGGDKSGLSEKRFYKQLIDRADKLYAVHLNKINTRNAKR